jgi:hypothetical protein
MNVSTMLLMATIGQISDPPKVQPDPPRPVVFLPMAPPTLMQRVFLPSQYALPQTSCSGPNCGQATQATQWQPFGGLFRRK